MNPFAEKYKTLSIARLIEITRNPQNYQPLAIEAAAAELEERRLGDAELALAEVELKAAADEEKVSAEKRGHVNDRFKSMAKGIARSFRPWQPLATRMGQLILFICIVQGVIALKLFWEAVSEMSFTTHNGGFPMVVSGLTLFFALFALSAAYLFLRGKAIGWILLSVFMAFFIPVSLTSVVFIVIRALHYSYMAGAILISAWITISEAALCSASAWIIYKKWMRRIYKIDSFWFVATIAIGVLCFLVVVIRLAT